MVGKTLSANQLMAAIQNANCLGELKLFVAEVSFDKVLNEDGTIRGVHYCAPSGKRSAVLQAAIKRRTPNELCTSMTVDGKDFRTVY